MAITKRTRFEVLRRDSHTCQYCGAKAPDVVLHIDHVMPAALGGSDAPDNLATACKDCNAGKSSIMPDSPLVKGLSEKAASYALGMVDKMTKMRASVETFDEYLEVFNEFWGAWRQGENKVPLPPDYELSLYRWHSMGVPSRIVEMAIPKAMKAKSLRGECAEFAYMAGIVWNIIKADEIDYSVTSETAAVYTENEMGDERVEAYEMGQTSGRTIGINEAFSFFERSDFLAHHIDGSTSNLVDRFTYRAAPVG